MKQIQNIKVGGRGDNLKLKAQSLKQQVISRFQLLIIYINSMQKVNKKVGEGEYGHYGHPTAVIRRLLRSLCSRVAIVGGKKVLRSLKKVGGTRVESRGLRLRAAGMIIFAVAAVWGGVMPANGAEAAMIDNL